LQDLSMLLLLNQNLINRTSWCVSLVSLLS
jgi:hypothetical protein